MTFRRSLLASAVALACAGVAKADTIATLHLSSHSSDATPAAWLDATFEFLVSGTSLQLTVTNDTLGGGDYNINEIYFNTPDSVSNFQVFGSPPTGWNSVQNAMVDGFGTFDFGMVDGQGENDPNVIGPGASETFNFTFTGSATADDFASSFSTLGFLIAAKFVSGPVSPDSPDGDDSAFGALIPLPPALPMGIAGLIGVAVLGRRTRAKLPRPAA